MFQKIINKLAKNQAQAKDKEAVEELVEEGNQHLQELKKIDQKILCVQNSTKTTFSFFSPVHNYCRTQYKWYYDWHTKPYATKVHAGFLMLLICAGLLISSSSLLYGPGRVKAATYTCNWTGATDNSWNNFDNWGNCGPMQNLYPGETADTYNITIPAGKSVTLSMDNVDLKGGSLTVAGTFNTDGKTISVGNLTVSTGGTLTAGASIINVSGNWNSANGTFNANNSTVSIQPAGGASVTLNATSDITAPYTNPFFILETARSSGSGNSIINALSNIEVKNYVIVGADSTLSFSGTDKNLRLGLDGTSTGFLSYDDFYYYAFLIYGTFTPGTGAVKVVSDSSVSASFPFNIGNYGPNSSNSIGNLYIGDDGIGTDPLTITLGTDTASSLVVDNFTMTPTEPSSNVFLSLTASTTMTCTGNMTLGQGDTRGYSLYGQVIFSGANKTIDSGGLNQYHAIHNSITVTGTISLLSNALVTTGLAGNVTINTSASLNLNGQNITANAINNNGTLKLTGDETLSVVPTQGAASTVEYVAISGSRAIKDWTYTNLKINGTGGTFTLPSDKTVSGNLDVSAGTLNTSNGTARNLTVTGNLTITGTLIANSSTITVGGNWDNSTTGVFTAGTSTVVMNGTGSFNCGATPWGVGKRFQNLTINTSGTITFVTQIFMNNGGSIKLLSGTITGTGAINIYVPNINSFQNEGISFVDNKPPLIFLPNSTNQQSPDIIPPVNYAGDVEILSNGTAYNYAKLGGAINTAALALRSNQTTGGIILDTDTTNNYPITATSLTIGHPWGTATRAGQLNANNSTITVSGDLKIRPVTAQSQWESKLITGENGLVKVGGNFVNESILDMTSGGTIEFTKGLGTAQTLTSGGTGAGKSFNNLTHSGAGTLQLITNPIQINGNLTNSAGIFDANGQNISIAGNWDNSGTFTPGASTISVIGSGTSVIKGTNTFYNLAINTANASTAKTVNFASGVTQTITGALTLAGTAEKVLTLGRDGGSGTAKYTLAIPSGFQSGQYIHVSNSNITGGVIVPGSYLNVFDDGNNLGWDFDTTYPTITITSTPESPNGSGGYFKTAAPSISIVANDNSKSGVASISYRWGPSGDYTTVVSDQASTTAPERVNTLYVYSTDNLGNTNSDSPTTSEYKVDTVIPVTDIYPSVVPNGSGGYYKEAAPTITFTSSDGGSGTPKTYYKWGTNEFAEYSTALTPEEGVHTISYYGTDLAGNTTATFTQEFKVDTILPTISSVISAEPNTLIGWYKDAFPTITLNAADTSGSGVAGIKYRWGTTGDWSDYSNQITSLEGVHTLYYYATDNASNSSSTSNRTLQIDSSSPLIGDILPVTTNPTNKLDTTFTWPDVSDGSGSGVASYLVSLGSKTGESDLVSDQSVTENSFKYSFQAQGTYYIRVKAIDNVGHTSGFSQEGNVVIDLVSPLVTMTGLTDGQYITTKTTTLSGTSSDETSGIEKVVLLLDDNTEEREASSSDNWKTWSYDWKDYPEGIHTIIAKAIGKAGNVARSTTFSITVDTTAPTIPADFRGFNVSNVPASVFATYIDFADSKDETSGMKSYEIYKGNTKLTDVPTVKEASNTFYTGNQNQPYFLVDPELSSGKYSYKIRATDNAGNISETPELIIDTAGKAIEIDNIVEAKGNPSSVVTKTKTSAIVTWKTTYPATSYVEYGENSSYGKKTDIDNNMNQGHSVLLADLKPATTYHAKVKSRDIYGKELESSDLTFATKQSPDDQSAIKVIIDAIQSLIKNITAGAADSTSNVTIGAPTADQLSNLQGFSNNLLLTDISFKEKGYFGNILSFEKNKKIEKSTDDKSYGVLTSAGNVYYLDKEIKENTSYYYRLDSGNPIVRKPVLGDDSPLVNKDASVIKESVQTSKNKAQLTVHWTTNRGATSQVEFGTSTSYGQKTKEDSSLNMGHNVILEDLNPDTTYHFKVTSKDSKGNITVSDDFTFQTPSVQKDKSPIDIIFESFQRIFNAIRGIF